MSSLWKEIDQLKEKDPEFYEFLQKEDMDLMKSIQDDDDEEEEIQSETEDRDAKENNTSIANVDTSVHLCNEKYIQIENWLNNEKCSQSKLSLVVSLFHDAFFKEDFQSESSDLFNKMVILVLKRSHFLFKTILGDRPTQNPKWKHCQKIIKKFLQTVIKLLETVSEESVLSFVLTETQEMAFLFVCLPKFIKPFLRSLLQHWTLPLSPSSIQLLAFLNLYKIALASQESTLLSILLKLSYVEFIRRSNFCSLYTADHILFLRNGCLELFRIQTKNAYEIGFLNIRQLAVTLRTAITDPSKEHLEKVFNWQFLTALRFWSVLVGHECSDKFLSQLTYPLIQVTLGALKLLKNSPKYFPYELHCLRIITDLVYRTKIFVPLCQYIFPLIRSSEQGVKSSANNSKSLEFSYVFKVSKAYCHGRAYKEAIALEACDLMLDYLCAYVSFPSFPEMVAPIAVTLKRMIKNDLKNIKIIRKIQRLLTKLQEEQNSILVHRISLKKPPTELKSCIDVDAHPLCDLNKWDKNIKEKQLKALHTSNKKEDE